MFGALTEYRCYNTSLGLFTIPEGLTQCMAEQNHMSPEYQHSLFNWVIMMQGLQLTEFEEHLLKSITLFNPGKCSNGLLDLLSANNFDEITSILLG